MSRKETDKEKCKVEEAAEDEGGGGGGNMG